MGKDFGKSAGSAFQEVAKKDQEKAQVVTLQWIDDAHLEDNPKNGEDVAFTEDLERSIREIGFTDPIEVTDYKMEPGSFMIVSGHRRRQAGRKTGMQRFPCIVRHFTCEAELENYTLWSNAQRDSARDPFLFCKRYKLHEEYLKNSGFQGSKREEIARRLGLSPQQADRYNAMNRIITPVWDMVRAEQVGMSSVQPMAAYSPQEQGDILKLMTKAIEAGHTLTRDAMKSIIAGYKAGKSSLAEIAGLPRDSSLPLNGFTNTEPGEDQDAPKENRNDEMRRERDLIGEEADAEEAAREKWERERGKGEEEKQRKRAAEIVALMEKLTGRVQDVHTPEDQDEAERMVRGMGGLICALLSEMRNVSGEFGLHRQLDDQAKIIKQAIKDLRSL